MKRLNVTRMECPAEQGGKKEVKVDMVIDKGIGRESYDPKNDLQEFEENGLHGLKTPDGQVVYPAEYDRIFKWPDSDVIYTLKGKEYHYYNTAGDEILTDVPPVAGLEQEEDLMPWFITEEQHRPYVIIISPVDAPSGGRCCLYRGQWVELGRIARKEVRRMMKVDTSEFDNEFSYIYSGYEVKAAGMETMIGECVGKLRDLGCYQSSWNYLTRVFFPRGIENPALMAYWVMAEFDANTPLDLGDLRRISFGVDDTLKEDEMRIVQIHYFHDRWPLVEEQTYESLVVNGSLEEMLSARAAALTAIQETCLKEMLRDVLWDFPRVKNIPPEMYECKDAFQMGRKLDWLKSSGYGTKGCLFETVNHIAEEIRYRSLFKPATNPQEEFLQKSLWKQGVYEGEKRRRKNSFDFGKLLELAGWYVSNGEDINFPIGFNTPMDILDGMREKLGDTLTKESLAALENIISGFRALGGMTMKEIEEKDGLQALLERTYSYVNLSEITETENKE